MKASHGSQFSSVWGKVTKVQIGPKVQIDPSVSRDVLVTVAEQVLRFSLAEGEGAVSLGLLRVTNKKVFLIVGENKTGSKNFILAGWKNPQNRVVLVLQPLVLTERVFDLKVAILKENPDWKSWSGSFGS